MTEEAELDYRMKKVGTKHLSCDGIILSIIVTFYVRGKLWAAGKKKVDWRKNNAYGPKVFGELIEIQSAKQ